MAKGWYATARTASSLDTWPCTLVAWMIENGYVREWPFEVSGRGAAMLRKINNYETLIGLVEAANRRGRTVGEWSKHHVP